MLMQPWNPELIKYRSSLHEPTRGGKPMQVRYMSPPAAENPCKFVT